MIVLRWHFYMKLIRKKGKFTGKHFREKVLTSGYYFATLFVSVHGSDNGNNKDLVRRA
jgi:hypothetical protein